MRWKFLVAVFCIAATTGNARESGGDAGGIPEGTWHVVMVYSGTAGRKPARDFVVEITHPEHNHLAEVRLSGINSHVTWMQFNGEHLLSACYGSRLCTSTLLGCGRRVGAAEEENRASASYCLKISKDEDLLARILTAPSSWHENAGLLVLRSNAEDGWMELRH